MPKERNILIKMPSAFDSALANGSSMNSGCCCPTTSSLSLVASSANSVVTVVSRPKSRGIVHTITESGKARLVFENNFTRLKGILLNQYEESFSISGSSTANDLKVDPLLAFHESLSTISESGASEKSCGLDRSRATTKSFTTTRMMTITVVDGEVGQTFGVEDVEVEITVTASPPPSPSTGIQEHPPPGACNGGTPQFSVEIKHPAIRFQTDEVFIGNKAEIEIRKYLGLDLNRLLRTNSRSGQHNHHPSSPSVSSSAAPLHQNAFGIGASTLSMVTTMYVGAMELNIMSMERTAPSMRRMSTCDSCTTNIIEQANDFLV